jgi:hypothetical protein
MARWLMILAAAATLAALAGCAAMNYPTYAQQQGAVISETEKTKQETAKALGQAVASTDARTRDMGVMGLLVLALTNKTPDLAEPRESALERGLGQAVAALPGVAQVVGLAHALKDAGGSHTSQQVEVSGQGAGGGISTGSGPQTVSPATSPPTVVEQPPPVVLGGE